MVFDELCFEGRVAGPELPVEEAVYDSGSFDEFFEGGAVIGGEVRCVDGQVDGDEPGGNAELNLQFDRAV